MEKELMDYQYLPHPLDYFCARLRAVRIGFRVWRTGHGMSIVLRNFEKDWERASAIWLGTCTREALHCEA